MEFKCLNLNGHSSCAVSRSDFLNPSRLGPRVPQKLFDFTLSLSLIGLHFLKPSSDWLKMMTREDLLATTGSMAGFHLPSGRPHDTQMWMVLKFLAPGFTIHRLVAQVSLDRARRAFLWIVSHVGKLSNGN